MSQHSRKRSIFNLVIRLIITAGLLTLVCVKAGVFSEKGRESLGMMLADANIYFLVLSVLIQFLLNASSALKWWMLLSARKVFISFGRIWAYYLIGQFYNLILPTSMGGDVVRIHELGRFTGCGTEAVASVFVERFTGMIMLAALTISAICINLNQFNHLLINLSLVIFTGVVIFVGWLTLDPRPYAVFEKIIHSHLPVFTIWLGKITKFRNAVHEYQKDKQAIVWAFINSLVFYFLAILNVWISAKAFESDMTLSKALIVTPVILLLMNFPISIGGIGLMEFSYTYTFDLIGIGSDVGLSTALVMRAKMFMDAAIGAMCHPLVARGRSIPKEIEAALIVRDNQRKT